MTSMKHVSKEDRANIWIETIQPEIARQLIVGNLEHFGGTGEIIDGMLLCRFLRNTLDVFRWEPMVSEYGVALYIPMPIDAYSRFARIRPPMHPYIVNDQKASLPLYVFGVSLKEFPLSGFLTFYKILFNDEPFLRSEIFRKNELFASLLYNIKNQGEWRFEKKKDSIDQKYIYLPQYFEEDDLGNLKNQIDQEFERIGEILTVVKKNYPPKKILGLF